MTRKQKLIKYMQDIQEQFGKGEMTGEQVATYAYIQSCLIIDILLQIVAHLEKDEVQETAPLIRDAMSSSTMHMMITSEYADKAFINDVEGNS